MTNNILLHSDFSSSEASRMKKTVTMRGRGFEVEGIYIIGVIWCVSLM